MPYNNEQQSIMQMFLNKNSILNASQTYASNNQSGIYGDQSNRILTSPEPMLKSSIRKEFRSKFANMTPEGGSPDQQAILISEAYSNEEYPFQLENEMKTRSRFVPQETFNQNKAPIFSRLDDRDNRRSYTPERDEYNDRYSRERDSPLRYDDRQSKRGGGYQQQPSGFDRSIREDRMERSRSPEIRSKQSFQDERPRFQYRSPAEERFSQEEVEILRGNFDAYSKDNRLSEFHLLKLLSLEDFEKSFIGNRIYNCIKQISSKGATFGNYVNYERYVQAMAILARGTIQERLDFVYNIFDPRGEGRITYEEMNIVMGDLFRILRSTKFEHSTLNALCEKVILKETFFNVI